MIEKRSEKLNYKICLFNKMAERQYRAKITTFDQNDLVEKEEGLI